MEPRSESNFGRIALIYIFGLLLGGIYVGLVSPLRTVIQADLNIDSTLGIWMINIYTLFYAALIPISGNLADRYGRRPVFLVCLLLFVAGSLACGLSQATASLPVLLAGRVVQAAGAGGIIPAATAEIGTTAPPDKRGMWLGIAAAVSGIANVFGAAVGSLVVSIIGTDNWGWAFYIAVPIGLVLCLCAYLQLPRREAKANGPLDLAGSFFIAAFVVVLLLALTNIDTSAVLASIASIGFIAPLVGAVVLAAVLVLVERRAANPVVHLEFFSGRCMPIIMGASFFIGCSIISMQLIPEFVEYALDAPLGSGGYYIAIIGIFAIAGPPLSGKLIDRFGAKPVLIGGLIVSTAGFAFLATVVCSIPSMLTMLVGLAIMGLGMGFSMGTPLNYLTLQVVPEEVSTSAIATITLVRQVGTTLFPALLVSFTTTGLGMAGYSHMFFAVVAVNLLAIVLMVFYSEKRMD